MDKTFYDAEEYLSHLSDSSDDFEDAREYQAELFGAASSETYHLHRLAFEGKADQLGEALKRCTDEEKSALDPQGNSILHLGIMRNNRRVVQTVIDHGVSTKLRNAQGWDALEEAIATKNKDMVCFIYAQGMKEVKAEVKAAKVQLIQTLGEMPDYSMELSWQLGSPVIGYLLRKFAPHDTYRIYKMGHRIRMDGTLMGVDKTTSSLLPEWKRGNFSLLFDGSVTPSLVYLVFHDSKEYLDLTEEKLERKRNGRLEFDADFIMAENVGKTKLQATEFRFKPVKGWMMSQLTEKIEDWNTRVYEASGKMKAVTRLKQNLKIPHHCTFEQYLTLKPSEEKVLETSVGPSGLSVSSENHDCRSQQKAKPKKLSGRCWMAEDFPMSLRQLLPLLDVAGHANKHLGRVSKFMRKYGDMNMFPVRIQVPLLLTVYLSVSFKKFKFAKQEDGRFEIPKDYKRIRLEDVLSTASLDALTGRSKSEAGKTYHVERSFTTLLREPIEY